MSTARVFDELWSRYDAWYERNRVIAMNELEAVRSLGLVGRGLEVGVGTGWFASRLGTGYGVDPSIAMLRVAHGRGVETAQAVGERLPFRSGVFDYVLLVVTLCFVDDPLLVLRESARVTRPGGRVAACIVPRESSWGAYYMERARESPFYRVARFISTKELLEMMRSAGLEPAEAVSTLSFPPWGSPRPEKPWKGTGGGFTCIAARKPG